MNTLFLMTKHELSAANSCDKVSKIKKGNVEVHEMMKASDLKIFRGVTKAHGVGIHVRCKDNIKKRRTTVQLCGSPLDS